MLTAGGDKVQTRNTSALPLYSPLEGRQIRLLYLEPAVGSRTPTQRSLSRVCLNDNPRYEGLSYAWDTEILRRCSKWGVFNHKITSYYSECFNE